MSEFLYRYFCRALGAGYNMDRKFIYPLFPATKLGKLL